MPKVDYEALKGRFAHHIIKEVMNNSGVEIYFCYRPNFIDDSFTLTSVKGVVTLNSPSFGSWCLQILENDPIEWLYQTPEVSEWLAKVPDTFAEAYRDEDSEETWLMVSAIERALQLIEKAGFAYGRSDF